MNRPFHTPSFGDEVFELPDIETNAENLDHEFSQTQEQQNFLFTQQTKRMDDKTEVSLNDCPTVSSDSYSIDGTISPLMISMPTTAAARKQLSSDANEPPKPLSTYALFFRDTMSAIKQQNPSCSFQELSRIVSSMWEVLDPNHKSVYIKKSEIAKSEYAEQVRVYRQQQAQQQQQQQQQLAAQQKLQSQQQTSTPIQTKPAVFTIARTNYESNSNSSSSGGSGGSGGGANNSGNNGYFGGGYSNHMNAVQQAQQLKIANPFQQHMQPVETQVRITTVHHHLEAEQPQLSSSTLASNFNNTPPPDQQIQLLTEAGSVQKCIRDNCNKRAIINPDWEDEYCSNECVIIHCRNVFNAWVKANKDSCK